MLMGPLGTLNVFLCIGGMGAFYAGLIDLCSFLNLYALVNESVRFLSGHGDL